MAKRVTTECVAAQQRDIYQKHQRPNANAKVAVKPESIPRIARQEDQKHQREIQKISMDVLQD
jgi:hypothetical protein